MNFDNSYMQLGESFYQQIRPTPVSQPKLLLWNQPLADTLGMAESVQQDNHLLAQYFSGNKLPEGAESIALAYAGHQFGHFNPQLGDGRAHLLGEIIDTQNVRRDIQLKGSGPTHFSRQGDGRCALAPALREYIMSEAMHALGVPTTRSLAVVASGETVYRERPQPGAIVTRVASSHIRVGTFQYFAARNNMSALEALVDYSIQRHFAHTDLRDENKILRFMQQVMQRQINLMVEWMRIGFIHGVMNTDNTAISGETIDFGPCAMLGVYHPGTVYSSIDRQGRYAFGNQPLIAQWNMARLAEALLPLIDRDQQKALKQIEPLVHDFSHQFEQAYFAMLSKKAGLTDANAESIEMVQHLLTAMQTLELDYTQTFNRLTDSLKDESIASALQQQLGDWYQQWRTKLEQTDDNLEHQSLLMRQYNPLVIPRNHHMEAVLSECIDTGSMQAAEQFLQVLRSPYSPTQYTAQYQDLPADNDRYYQTFCGT
ncbi:protein adenylyltransferase SelO [Neptunicella sp. SCSIO 80796]|uniref:protein adenylyltransferase SelO n=1 Tax=Neptunicella plasticusilytica TaxID=3117012 RepID=UPI003A4DC0EA